MGQFVKGDVVVIPFPTGTINTQKSNEVASIITNLVSVQ